MANILFSLRLHELIENFPNKLPLIGILAASAGLLSSA